MKTKITNMKKLTKTEYLNYIKSINERIALRESLEKTMYTDRILSEISFENWTKWQNGELQFNENDEMVPVTKQLTKYSKNS
jgi:hypothetical protein